tara:strand:+ start:1117 stop:1650 length:534 start_codon:yes stop_codon:yes gene_type:complete
MKIIAVYIVDCQHQEFITKNNLSFVSFLNRTTVKELMDAYVLHIISKMQQPERKIFEHESYIFSCQRIEHRGCVIITDKEYPSRVSFNILNNMFQDSSLKHLQTIVDQYQDPRCIDKLTSIQSQLDETLVIMHENISLVLERGQNIDDLVQKSERLSRQSKMFYKVARQHNRCCTIC